MGCDSRGLYQIGHNIRWELVSPMVFLMLVTSFLLPCVPCITSLAINGSHVDQAVDGIFRYEKELILGMPRLFFLLHWVLIAPIDGLQLLVYSLAVSSELFDMLRAAGDLWPPKCLFVSLV